MDVWIVLKDFEGKMADLYGWFSKMFSENGEAAALFYNMSLEEASHRDLVRYQRRLVSRNPKHFKEVDVDVNKIKEGSQKIDSLIGASAPLSLKEAVEISITFEIDTSECYYRSAMIQSNLEVAKLLDSLCTADQQHSAKLTDFAGSRGFAA